MHRKMKNKTKMIYCRSVKNCILQKKGGGAPKGILSTRTCENSQKMVLFYDKIVIMTSDYL